MSNPILDNSALMPVPFDEKMEMLVGEGVAWLYSTNPFWAAMLSSNDLRLGYVPPAIEDQITTAATDGFTTIWLNREFFTDIFKKCDATGVSKPGALLYVLLHECAHILADHTSEYHQRALPDRQTAAMAVDYQVFDMLAKDGLFPPLSTNGRTLFDPCPINEVSTRQQDQSKIQFYGDVNMRRHVPEADDVVKIYEYLLKGAQGGGKSKGQGNSQAMNGDVRPDLSPGGGDEPGDGSGDQSGDGDRVTTSSLPKANNTKAEQREQMIASAVMAAKAIGNMSHAANRAAEAITKSKTPWQKQLANLMSASCARAVERKRSYRRLGRRTDPSTPEYIVKPGRIRDPKPGILLVADCSGSISDSELQMFASECEGILRSGKVGYIRVIYCDTVVTDNKERFGPRDKVTLKPTSSGGTDFEPVWHWQKKHMPDAAAIVYLTDLLGSFGDKKTWPKAPVIWGATTEYHPPFGKPVRIKR